MLSQEALLGLVGRIYDAATDETLWPVFLEDFADAVNGTMTGLWFHNLVSPETNLAITVRSGPDLKEAYKKYYGAIDPWKAAGLARHRHPGPDTVYTGEELIGSEQFRKLEFYNDFVLPNQIVRHFGSPLAINPQWVSNISSHRPGDREPFGPVEMDLLKVLLPHLQRAVQIHGRFVELQGKQRASLDALDQLPIGVILLNQDTSIAAMNREAGRLIGQSDGLSACKYGVRAAGTATNRQLQVLITSAVRTGSGQGFESGGFLAIPRTSGPRAFSVLVTPVGKRAFAPDTNSPAAVVFVTDPERIPESAAQSLARIYDLTAAECRLSALLMQGDTLVRAAGLLGISHNTARTHLQRIYEKTSTRHQGDLIRLLTTGIPNFAPK